MRGRWPSARSAGRTRSACPPSRSSATLAAVIEEARAWTRGLVELPDGEGVALEIVHDQPWWASCDYLGDLRSRIAVNVDLPLSAIELLILAMHETYPGHHAERCCKEHLLVRGRGLLEETLVLVPTPQTLVTEGIGKLAPEVLLEGEGGTALAAVMHDAGIELDLAHALAVERALGPCRWAWVNAALMLYDAGASEAETHAYLERWGLMTPERAAHTIRFLTEPTTRTYVITYAAGADLCGRTSPASPSASAPADGAGTCPRPAGGRRRRRAAVHALVRPARPPRARAPRSAGSSRGRGSRRAAPSRSRRRHRPCCNRDPCV